MGRIRGLGAQHGTQQAGDVIIVTRAGAAGARGIVQSREFQIPMRPPGRQVYTPPTP